MIDIGKLQTDVAWLKKWLERLMIASGGALAIILLYIYLPLRDLNTSVAVQTVTLNTVGSDLRDIKDSVKAIDKRMDDEVAAAAKPQPSPPAGAAK